MSPDSLSKETDRSVSEGIQRIIPLGLTVQEAKAWYRYDVTTPLIREGLLTTSFGIMLILSTLTPLGDYLESDLVLHMIPQHLIFIVAGFLLFSGLSSLTLATSYSSKNANRMRKTLVKANSVVNKRGFITFVIAALLIAYWYVPANFDAAVLNDTVHIQMHFTFIVVGALAFIGTRSLSKRARHFAPVIAGKAMGMFGALLLLTTRYVYSTYPLSEQTELGVVMVVMMLVIDLTIVPYELYNYFGKASSPSFSS